MATKPRSASKTTECVGRTASAEEHPWLRAYPKTVSWDSPLKPALLGELLDQSVATYGPNPCTYFMGKRLSYSPRGCGSSEFVKGLR
jgi:long-chain acyl-CoA synthetase